MVSSETIMYKFICILSILLLTTSCKPQPHKDVVVQKSKKTNSAVHIPSNSNTIEQRFPSPDGYKRVEQSSSSFATYLRTLKLKPAGSLVKYYNGAEKANPNIYVAVVDLDIGTKDLHQCADAIMRLRAEYLWHQKKYDQIHFNFTNGFQVDYSEYMKGKRMQVKGNRTYWNNRAKASNSYADLWSYLELIFTYAGTASLEKELHSRNIKEAQIGDVLIQGGHPGHAVIIVDQVTNKAGKSLYLLAQSYMPAQEIQILSNPMNRHTSPWYDLDTNPIQTPEWTFNPRDLKHFND